MAPIHNTLSRFYTAVTFLFFYFLLLLFFFCFSLFGKKVCAPPTFRRRATPLYVPLYDLNSVDHVIGERQGHVMGVKTRFPITVKTADCPVR